MKVLFSGKTMKGVPTTIPIEQVGMVQDRNTEVHLSTAHVKDENGDPEIIRITDMAYEDVIEHVHAYYNQLSRR